MASHRPQLPWQLSLSSWKNMAKTLAANNARDSKQTGYSEKILRKFVCKQRRLTEQLCEENCGYKNGNLFIFFGINADDRET